MNDELLEEYDNPKWLHYSTPIEWHYYITDILRVVWPSFTLEQKRWMKLNAASLARNAMAEHYKFG